MSALSTATATVVSNLSERLERDLPVVVRTGESIRLRRPDRRLSWGIGRRDGSFTMALLVEKEDSWALNKARELKEEEKTHVEVTVVGQAHSSRPEKVAEVEREARLRPGLSISHFSGFAGSLGCLVSRDDYLGVLGASHVLGMNNTASEGDPILHPGNPDGPAVAENKLGTLVSYRLLVHYQSTLAKVTIANTADAALVRILDEDRCPTVNWVPNPKDPEERRISIKGIVSAEQLFEHLGAPMYKLGRTSGFTRGTLEYSNVQRYPIRLPDGKVYIYEDIACIKTTEGSSFSEPGDSGSLVYTEEGLGIGLVIGGSNQYTFVSPLSACLREMKAQLLQRE
jgi:hypothetical protein